MSRNKLVYVWLMGLGVAHAIGGVLLVVLADTALIQHYVSYLSHTVAGSIIDHSAASVLLTLFGPTVASWGLLFCVAVDYYYTCGKPHIKWASLLAILVWLILDCGISGVYGLYWHWFINGFMGLALCLPLWLLKPAS